MYVKQLSQKEQDYIYARLEHFFIKEGLTGEELQQAIQDGMDSKASDLEDIHGNTLYNTCLECEESWNIFEWMGADDLSLDDTDYENLRNHGQLYCVCSDCGGDDQSVLKEEFKMVTLVKKIDKTYGGCDYVEYDMAKKIYKTGQTRAHRGFWRSDNYVEVTVNTQKELDSVEHQLIAQGYEKVQE